MRSGNQENSVHRETPKAYQILPKGGLCLLPKKALSPRWPENLVTRAVGNL